MLSQECERGTFCVLGECENHYSTVTAVFDITWPVILFSKKLSLIYGYLCLQLAFSDVSFANEPIPRADSL